MSFVELILLNLELMSFEGQVNSLRFIGKLCTSTSNNLIVRDIVSMVRTCAGISCQENDLVCKPLDN